MTIIQRDVKLVYDSPPGNLIATPSGSSLIPVASGIPAILGTGAPPPPGADLFLDFNNGTDNFTLGINMAGSQTAYGLLPWRKHSWVPVGGFDGGGYIRMTWFTGMSIGFSPVQVEAPGGFQPHYELRYQVRQSNTMVHSGSAIKLLRLVANGSRTMGTMEWGNGSAGTQRLKWFYDAFAIAPPASPNKSQQQFCAWDTVADQGVSCAPKLGGSVDGNWHEWVIECDYRDPEAVLISISIDGALVSPSPHQLNAASAAGFTLPAVGSRYDISPFCEMYSCGSGGCEASINSGTYDVDHFSYTILP